MLTHTNNYRKYTYINFLFTTVFALVGSILAIYLKNHGFSDITLSMLYSFFPLAIIVTLPIIGDIADNIGKKNMILMAIAAEFAALLLYMTTLSIISVVIARILDAVAIMTLTVITLAKAEDNIKKDRGKKSGIFLSIGYIGKVLAPPIALVLADHLFIEAPFAIAMIILIVLFVMLFDKKEFHFKLKRSEFNYFDHIRTFLSHKKLRGMAILGIVAHTTSPFTFIFLPLYIVDKLNYPISYVGYAVLALNITHIVQFVFGKLSDRYGPERFVIAGLGIYGLGILMIYFTNSYWMLVLCLFITGIGGSMWNVSAWDLLSDVGEKIKHEALVTTTFTSIAKTGALAAFLISGFIVSSYGFQTYTMANGLLILVGCGAASGLFFRKYKR